LEEVVTVGDVYDPLAFSNEFADKRGENMRFPCSGRTVQIEVIVPCKKMTTLGVVF